MFNWQAYLWCATGIVISVLLPILWAFVSRSLKPTLGPGGGVEIMWGVFWQAIKPYVALGVASLLTAILIVALAGDSLQDYRAALLAGYAWDSTLQKFRGSSGLDSRGVGP